MTDAVLSVIIIAVVLLALSGARKRLKHGCCSGGEAKIKPRDKNPLHYPYKVRVYIDGMTCSHCSATVENAFNALGHMAKVNLRKHYADILTKAELSDERIAEIIKKSGYEFIKCER